MVARDGWEAGRRVGVVIKGQHEGSLGGGRLLTVVLDT